MKTTLDLPEDLLKKAMKLSNRKTKTSTIILALEEYIRRKKLERVISMEGALHFSEDMEDARHER